MRRPTTSTTSWCASWPAATRARSAPCRGAAARRRRAPFLLALLGWLLGATAAGDYWVQPAPQDPAETALHLAAYLPAESGRLEALAAISQDHAGTAASGLAQLAIGLVHLDAKRFPQAQAALLHPDLRLTELADLALFSLARAHEGARQDPAAAQTYLQVAESHPRTPMLCEVLSRAADAFSRTSQRASAVPLLERVLGECPGYEPSALLRLGQFYEGRGRLKEAADYYDRADCDYPASPRSVEAARRLRALARSLPPLPAGVRFDRDLRKAVTLSDQGKHKQALPLLASLQARQPGGANAEIVRMRLARALIAQRKESEAVKQLQAVPATSVFGAEAAYLLARVRAQREKRPQAYEQVVAAFPGTQWAEEALLSLAQHYLKDARYSEAVPHFRRLLAIFPDGRYLERASWWVGWWDYLSNRLEDAAATFEDVAKKRPDSLSSAGALYWAARARQRLGQPEAARALFEQTVRRFKHTYHGLRAGEALGLVREGASSTSPAESPPPDGRNDVPEPQRARVRQLLLIARYEEAMNELERVSGSAQAQATVAWIHRRRGQIRPAILAMRRAYPDWRSESGDTLPFAVWRILYPLDFEEQLVARARDEGLDAALMAGVIWQESAFDARALSVAGARGLMQLIPPTARVLARGLGQKVKRPEELYEPARNLQLGARYLKGLIDRFGGRVERALAAYNAGPSRVVRWTAQRPDMSAEEFIENIPFTETRQYVMNILAHRERYRRIYSLPAELPPALEAVKAQPEPPATEQQQARERERTGKEAAVKKRNAPRKTARKGSPRRRAPEARRGTGGATKKSPVRKGSSRRRRSGAR